jgi:hypothetical protein
MSEPGDTADDASGLGEEHRSPIQTSAEPRTPVWAKLMMGLQSATSLVILGLVIARAVNVLT